MSTRDRPLSQLLLLSICVPNRNQRSGLEIQETTLRSFATLEGVEVIVSDNESEDDSADYISKHWSDFAITSLLSENVGMVGNLRALCAVASGEWVWFLGSGDLPVSGEVDHLLNFLASADKRANLILDEGAYECVFPYLGGVLFRRTELLDVMNSVTNDLWPHVPWSIEIEFRNPEAPVLKTSTFHVEPWTTDDDWHATKSMFPFAVALNELLTEAAVRPNASRRIASDLIQTQKALLTWCINDKLAGKRDALLGNLAKALRLSGGPTSFVALKLLVILVTLLPIQLLRLLQRTRVQLVSVSRP